MWLSKPPAGIQLNRNHPLVQGLVGCWLFNEGSGLRANDLTGNSNTGVLTNFEPMSSTSGWTGGSNIHGTSLMFDGVNDFVNCGNNPSLNPTTALTLEAWINLNGNVQIDFARIIDKFIGGNPGSGYSIDIETVRNVVLSVRTVGGGGADLVSTGTINSVGIQHIVGVFDFANRILYLNGQEDSRQANAGTIINTNTLSVLIGSNLATTVPFKGTISLIRIWNRALSSQEIQQLYAHPYTMFWNPSERIRKNYDSEILI